MKLSKSFLTTSQTECLYKFLTYICSGEIVSLSPEQIRIINLIIDVFGTSNHNLDDNFYYPVKEYQLDEIIKFEAVTSRFYLSTFIVLNKSYYTALDKCDKTKVILSLKDETLNFLSLEGVAQELNRRKFNIDPDKYKDLWITNTNKSFLVKDVKTSFRKDYEYKIIRCKLIK